MNNGFDSIKQDIDFTLTSDSRVLPQTPEKNAVLILYADRNEAQITAEDRAFRLNKGEVVVVEAVKPLFWTPERQGVRCFRLAGELVEKHWDRILCDQPLPLMETGMLGTVIKHILAQDRVGWTEAWQMEQAFSLLLGLVSCSYVSEPKPPLVMDACEVMDNGYAHLYSVEDVADSVGVDKAHLIRVFKSTLGITPGHYMETVRMENARRFLANRSLSLSVVAGLSGYANANYFGKVFKKRFGISPKAYRQLTKERAPLSEDELPGELYL